jgi:hypothetical protein
MSFIPPAVAQRIDRLSRNAHRFHRFAHHPLCSSYAGEVIRLGHRIRVCRGCAFAFLGASLGVSIGAVFRPTNPYAWVLFVSAAGLLLGSLRWRFPKLVSRLIPAACLGALLWHSVAVAGAVSVAVAAMLWQYRRRGPHRRSCLACPERAAAVCSGFAPIIRREKAFQRLSAIWLTRARRDERNYSAGRYGAYDGRPLNRKELGLSAP